MRLVIRTHYVADQQPLRGRLVDVTSDRQNVGIETACSEKGRIM